MGKMNLHSLRWGNWWFNDQTLKIGEDMLGRSRSQLLFFPEQYKVGKICSPMNESLLWHPPQLGVEVEQKETPHFIYSASHYKGRKIFWLWLSKVSAWLKWSPRSYKLCWRNLGTTLRGSLVLFQANNFQIIALTFLPLSKGQQR